jgi:hypothetical protein
MTPRWLINRLRCMGPAEVMHRATHALVLPLVRSRLREQAPRGDGVVFARAGVPPLDAIEVAALLQEAASIAAGRVPLFASQEIAFTHWHAQEYSGDIKPLWELNRHLHLVRLAQAWAITGDERWRTVLSGLLHSWLEQCPPPHGPQWKSGLELGIRLISWSLIWQMLQGRVDADLHGPWLASIHAHCGQIAARLSRHSSANNHLIGELTGLYMAACTWPCWPESAAWRAQAQRELEHEADVQFTAEGVHREQAYAYQVFCCDFLLVAGMVGQTSGTPFSPAYHARLQRALSVIRVFEDVGQNLGDADDGCVWRLQSRRDIPRCGDSDENDNANNNANTNVNNNDNANANNNAMRWLRHLFPGPALEAAPATSAWAFPDAGYYLFGTKGRVQGMVDCGPLGYLGIAAHGHADALALTLHVNGEPCLVDSGTFDYWSDVRWRDYFRGTSAHNTVRVDGLDQSVGGGRFLWLRKACTRVEHAPKSPAQFDLSASHDGYARLPDPVVHARRVTFDEASVTLVVTDHVTAKCTHRSEIFWHVAPQLDVTLAGQCTTVHGHDYTLVIAVSCGTLDLVRGADHPPLGWYSRAYKVKEPCTVLRIVNESSDVRVECQITITFL